MTIGLIGFGYWGKKIFSTLATIGTERNVVVLDFNPSRREEALAMGLSSVNDFDSLLILSNACIIATPEHTHEEVLIKCLLAKKHVLIEKPLAYSSEQAAKFMTLAERNNLVLMADNTFLYDEAYIAFKHSLNASNIGRVIRVDSVRRSWRKPTQDDSVITDLLPHDIYLFHNLFHTEPSGVISYVQKPMTDDLSTVIVAMTYDGCTTYSYLSWGEPRVERMMIAYGEIGRLCWEREDETTDVISTYIHRHFGNYDKARQRIIKRNSALSVVVQAFLRAINNPKQFMPDSAIAQHAKILETAIVHQQYI